MSGRHYVVRSAARGRKRGALLGTDAAVDFARGKRRPNRGSTGRCARNNGPRCGRVVSRGGKERQRKARETRFAAARGTEIRAARRSMVRLRRHEADVAPSCRLVQPAWIAISDDAVEVARGEVARSTGGATFIPCALPPPSAKSPGADDCPPRSRRHVRTASPATSASKAVHRADCSRPCAVAVEHLDAARYGAFVKAACEGSRAFLFLSLRCDRPSFSFLR